MIFETHGALSHIDFEPDATWYLEPRMLCPQYFLNQTALSPSALGFYRVLSLYLRLCLGLELKA